MPRQAKDHIDDPRSVGARLRETRRAAGLTQTDLTFPGCTTGYISRIESGERVPSLQVIRHLANQLDVRESWLAKGVDEFAPEQELVYAELDLRFGNVDEAERRFRSLTGESHPPRVRAVAEAGLGQVASRRGSSASAVEHLERATTLAPLDDAGLEALGRAYAALGRDADAIAVFRARFDQAVADGDAMSTVRFGVLLADELIDDVDIGQATHVLSLVLQAYDRTDDQAMARVRWSLARVHSLRGQSEDARREAAAALVLLDASENRLQYARAHHLLAFVELEAGNPDTALELAGKGKELLGEEASDADLATFELERARAFAQLGRTDEAASVAEHATQLTALHPVDVGRTYTEIATAFQRRGERERARELFERAIELLASRKTRFLAEAYARYGAFLEDTGDTAGALAAYRSGARLADRP